MLIYNSVFTPIAPLSDTMKTLLTLLFIISCFSLQARNFISWNKNYQLQLSDFRSSKTQIGSGSNYTIHSGSSFNSSLFRSKGGLVSTRNYNSRIVCNFRMNKAALQAPDSLKAADLLEFARYEFDLCELYTRKYRKQLTESSNAFSKAHFFHFFYESVQTEFDTRRQTAVQETDLGRNRERLASLRREVSAELDRLETFSNNYSRNNKRKATQSAVIATR